MPHGVVHGALSSLLSCVVVRSTSRLYQCMHWRVEYVAPFKAVGSCLLEKGVPPAAHLHLDLHLHQDDMTRLFLGLQSSIFHL
jgi:hypothetical protein